MLPSLKNKYQPHIIIANGENAAAGRGITSAIANEFFNWGVHGITMGNHTWDNKDIFEFIDDEPRIIRPANFPAGTPGRGYTIIKGNGKELAIVNLQGRTFVEQLMIRFGWAKRLWTSCAGITSVFWWIFTLRLHPRRSPWAILWTGMLPLL